MVDRQWTPPTLNTTDAQARRGQHRIGLDGFTGDDEEGALMGRKTAEIRVTARLSNHHDDEDRLDGEAWRRFVAEVQELSRQPEYAGLDIDVADMGQA